MKNSKPTKDRGRRWKKEKNVRFELVEKEIHHLGERTQMMEKCGENLFKIWRKGQGQEKQRMFCSFYKTSTLSVSLSLSIGFFSYQDGLPPSLSLSNLLKTFPFLFLFFCNAFLIFKLLILITWNSLRRIPFFLRPEMVKQQSHIIIGWERFEICISVRILFLGC